jgi:SWI/SNF-related matrix-associated actin-dependent regulator 1 of chromatin subfamily A
MGYQEAWANRERPQIDAVTGATLDTQADQARGFGSEVAEILASLPRGPRSVELLRAFLRSMPDELRADLGKLSEGQVSQKTAAVAIYHASLAMTYGVTADSVTALGYDAAKTAFCAAQSICLALGYTELSDAMRATVDPKLFFTRGTGDELILFFDGYNPNFVQAARNRSDIIKVYRKGSDWLRSFKAVNLPKVINILLPFWPGGFLVGPDGNLSVLPTKPSIEVPFPIEPLPRNIPVEALNEPPPPPPVLHIGDFVNYQDKEYVVVDASPQFPQRVGFRSIEKREGPADFYTVLEDLNSVKLISAREAALRLQALRLEEAKRLGGEAPPVLSVSDEEKLAQLKIPETAFEHQVDGIKFLWLKGRALLGDEPGLGKTLQSICASEFPTLVVCPNHLKLNWVREVGMWRPGSTVSVIEGRKTPPLESMRTDVVIIGYHLLAAHVDWLMRRKWKTIIADEVQNVKNMDFKPVQLDEYDAAGDRKVTFELAASSKGHATAFYQVQRANPRSRLYLLSGTAMMNRPKEMFPPMNMIDDRDNPFAVELPGRYGAPPRKKYPWQDYDYFCGRYCSEGEQMEGYRAKRKAERKEYNRKQKGLRPTCKGVSNGIELNGLIEGRFMLRRLKALLNLPSLSRFVKHVELSEKGARDYRHAAEDLIAYLRNVKGTAAAHKADRGKALAKLTTLRRLSAIGKVDALLDEIVEFRNGTGRPLIVMAVHKDVIELIARGIDDLNARGVLDTPLRHGTINGDTSTALANQIVNGFQGRDENERAITPTYDLVIMSIKKASGLTLTRASDMFFIEREWRPGDLVQAEGRMERIGQKNEMRAIYLDAPGTVDEFMANLLVAKAKAVAAVLDGVDLDEAQAQRQVLGEILGVNEQDPEALVRGIADMLERQLAPNSRDATGLPFTMLPYSG